MLRKREQTGEVPAESTGKRKKPFYKKWWFWVLVILFIVGSVSGGNNKEKPGEAAVPPSSLSSESKVEPSSEESGKESEKTEEPELPKNGEPLNGPEKFVREIVTAHGGKVSSLEIVGPDENNDQEVIIAALECPNDEAVIMEIANDISEAIKGSPEKDSAIFPISDIDSGSDTCIATVSVSEDGTFSVESMSIDYNSPRNQWIKSQFSAWDGSHTALKKLVIQQLNDEKSFKHSETTYRDICDETVRDEVNKVLSDSGYSQRVEVGDLFIQMTFSAKNAFNATIKNTAFGIASYQNDSITLIDIG